ncbi:polysaccharide pyruvyl transferase family protein [Luteimicrobium album]|nr:polysaccharide pyruvyl transferase family protein [Luteimicrobium album]
MYYPSPWAWIDSMKKQRFAFGSRLHGNIAALLAGTPAHLLAHDTRTLELAEYHGIPHSLIDSFDEPPTAAELYERSDYSDFNRLQPERFATYLEFLHRNGFETVFDERDSARAFDRSIRASRRTKPVVSRRG